MRDPDSILESIHGGVVVSCQAGPESPLNSPATIAALAASAERGGAVGFRIDGPDNVAAVRAVSALPILGINKRHRDGFEVFITATFDDALAVVRAGADLVALDGTSRPRPDGVQLVDLVRRVREECRVPVMADVSTAEEGRTAAAAGCDLVATTLAGYTPYSGDRDVPAFDIVEALAAEGVRVVVEGRIWTVEDVRRCFDAGAFAVVIGSAITVPEFITRRFAAATGRVGRR